MKTLVLYGDGGAHPNNGNGYAGSGIHGYLCTNEKPKSGLGIKQTATDLGYFDNIIPCGIRGKAVTSLNVELSVEKVNEEEVKEKILKHFKDLFEAEFTIV